MCIVFAQVVNASDGRYYIGGGRTLSKFESISAGDPAGIYHKGTGFQAGNVIRMVTMGAAYRNDTVLLRFHGQDAVPFTCQGVRVEDTDSGDHGAAFLVPPATVSTSLCSPSPCSVNIPLVFTHSRTQAVADPRDNQWVDSALEYEGVLDRWGSFFVHVMCRLDNVTGSLRGTFALFTLELRHPRFALVMDTRSELVELPIIAGMRNRRMGVDAAGLYIRPSSSQDRDYVVHRNATMFPMVHVRSDPGYLKLILSPGFDTASLDCAPVSVPGAAPHGASSFQWDPIQNGNLVPIPNISQPQVTEDTSAFMASSELDFVIVLQWFTSRNRFTHVFSLLLLQLSYISAHQVYLSKTPT